MDALKIVSYVYHQCFCVQYMNIRHTQTMVAKELIAVNILTYFMFAASSSKPEPSIAWALPVLKVYSLSICVRFCAMVSLPRVAEGWKKGPACRQQVPARRVRWLRGMD